MKPSLADMCCVVDTHNLSGEGCISTYYYNNLVLLDPPTLEDLQCLIHWPDNTQKHASEEALVKMLLLLGKSHGFAHVAAQACAIKDIHTDPFHMKAHQMVKDAKFAEQGWDKNPPVKDLVHQFTNIIFVNGAAITGDCVNCGEKAVKVSEHVNVCLKEVGR